jgi:hypothetical protein
LALSASTEDMLGERIGRRAGGERERLSNIVEEISMLALGVPYDRPPPPATQTSTLVDWLRTSANALNRSTVAEPALGDRSPAVRGYPQTTDAARRLGELLAEAPAMGSRSTAFRTGPENPHWIGNPHAADMGL